jgi:hypothetical protein
MGGMVRCVACGEVQWNLRARVDGEGKLVQRCRICDEKLLPERRRPGRFAAAVAPERRDATPGTAS